MEIGQKIWKIDINKPVSGTIYSSQEEGVFIKELEILGINSCNLVLNDEWFTTFPLKNESRKSWETYLDGISVRIYTNESFVANGVFITLHSTKKPSKKLLDKMVATACTEIDKKYGFLFGGVKSDIHSIVDNFNFAR